MDECQEWLLDYDDVEFKNEKREWSTCDDLLDEESIEAENISLIEFNTLIKNLIADNEIEELKTILSSSLFSETISLNSFEINNSTLHCSEKDIHDSNLKNFSLFDVYPIPNDPGFDAAFWILYPNLPIYKSDGINKFYDIIKLLRLTSVASLRQQLMTDKINLSFYGVDPKVIQALSEALLLNNTVQTLNLQENYLTADACYYLNRLLLQNTVLSSLNLSNCKIGVEGAMRLEEGISSSSALRQLNLSYCELGKEGFYFIAKAVAANTLVQKLDISYNNLDEGAALYMKIMLVSTESLESLNASWNDFYTKDSSEKLFSGLSLNTTLNSVDLSWNSFGKDSISHISNYISNTKNVKYLNLEANRLADAELLEVAQALLVNSSLQELNLNKNPFGSKGISEFIKLLNTHKILECPLLLIDFGNLWATKDSLPILEQVKEIKPNLVIKLGGILENFTIIGPDLKELFFMTANYETTNIKKKKKQRNFGHFVLSLEDALVSKEKFKELLMDAKIQISDNLTNEIINQFLVTKKSLDLVALKKSYLSYFPNTELPTAPATQTKIIDKPEIEKKKKKKVLQRK
ncbi:leucine-rich repeat-containing protein 74B, partial [Nasonia vitripennis]|uniref:Uncharacterized protein n=1 Tax=Nasonia vitripennis TaxID=7425 RepID=A0A7M7QE80_NASVI